MSKDLNIFFMLLTEDIILETMECFFSAGIED